MRIAVNTRFLLPGRLEGFGWYTHEIMRRMVAAHPEDEFLFLFDRPFDPAYIYGKNVTPVVVFPQARHPILFYLWFEWGIPKVIKRFNADVFFSPDSLLSMRADVPTVMTCHDLVPLHHPEQVARRHRYYYLRNLPRFLKKSTQVLTVSKYVAEDIAQTVGIPGERISVVYNGGREGFKPLKEAEINALRQRFSEGAPYFLYTGAIHPRKNIHRLIQAFDRFKTRSGAQHKLLLAGRFAWKTGAVKEAWNEAAHKADIHFLGYVPDNTLFDLYGAATALTYLSTSEGFGLPMVEAMCCDVPVLAADSTCLPEIAGDAALLVDPYDIEKITLALERLASDENLRKTLIENGRKQHKVFSWDLAAEQVYVCLKNAAKK